MVEVPTTRRPAAPLAWGDPPLAPTHASDGLGWPPGLAARRYLAIPAADVEFRPVPRHRLLVLRPSTPRLSVCCAGEGVSPDGRRELGSADPVVCLVPAGLGRRWAWDGGTVDVVEVLLSLDLLASFAAGRASLRPACADDDPVAARLAGVLESLLGEPCPAAPAVVAGVAPALCAHLLDRYAGEPAGGVGRRLSEAQQARAERYFEDNLDAPASTREMADFIVGRRCSVAHFSRLFKGSFGEPPYRHLLARRVAAARRLLAADPGLTVAGVAQDVGFFDHSHLNRHFRRATGANPRRNRAGNLAARAAGALSRAACSLAVAALAAAESLDAACAAL